MTSSNNYTEDRSFKDYDSVDDSDTNNTELSGSNIHVYIPDKIGKKVGVGVNPKGPAATITKQSMGYVTVKNIEMETGYLEQDWSRFVLKELIDNAYDWLNDYYPVHKEIRKIGIRIWKTREGNNKFIHIAVRNSNVNEIPVFENLESLFDVKVWCSTKRNQHRMTCGSLGDALKRVLGMGYASWTSDFNPDETFEDKQWNEPVIVRCNGLESKVFIKVGQDILTEVKLDSPSRDIGPDTEVEVILPLQGNSYYLLDQLKEYYRIQKFGKRQTTFDFYCGDI